MKQPRWLILLSALVVASGGLVVGQEPAAQGTVRILLTTGGHGFQAEPFYAAFDAMPAVEYTKAELPGDAGLLKPGLEREYDCLVMYDMVRGIAPEQQEAFKKLLERGIGVVSLHHNLGAHRDWDEFRKIIGGRFCLEDQVIDGKAYEQTPLVARRAPQDHRHRGRQKTPHHQGRRTVRDPRRNVRPVLHRAGHPRAPQDRSPQEPPRRRLDHQLRQEPGVLPDARARQVRLREPQLPQAGPPRDPLGRREVTRDATASRRGRRTT